MSRPIEDLEEPKTPIEGDFGASGMPDDVAWYYFHDWSGVPVVDPNAYDKDLNLTPVSQWDLRREEVMANENLSPQLRHQLLMAIDEDEANSGPIAGKTQRAFDAVFYPWWNQQITARPGAPSILEQIGHHIRIGAPFGIPVEWAPFGTSKEHEYVEPDYAALEELRISIYDALYAAFEVGGILTEAQMATILDDAINDHFGMTGFKTNVTNYSDLYSDLYRLPGTEGEDDAGGAAYEGENLTYDMWRDAAILKTWEIFRKRYGEDWQANVETNPETYGYYTNWLNWLGYLEIGDKDAADALVDDLLKHASDPATRWMIDEFEEFAATAPGKGDWLTGVKADYDEQWALIEETEAEVVRQEQERMQWVALYLGISVDDLTLQQRVAIKNNVDTMSPFDQARYQEIAEAYLFYGATGMQATESRLEADARAAYDTFMNSAAAQRLKEFYPDFETIYSRWKHYTQMAFTRAANSAFAITEEGTDLIVPFGIESFADWFAYDRAVTMIEHDIQVGTPLSEVQLGAFYEAMEALGIDPTAENMAFLQRRAGENDAEYFERLQTELNLDEDMINLGISHGLIAPSYSEVLTLIRPDVEAAITRYFLPRVQPGLRDQFMDELGGQLNTLWSMFVQRKGIEWPDTGDLSENTAAIEQYSQQFIDWMSQQNFTSAGMVGYFGSLIDQREAEAQLKRYTTTRRITPQSFGLGM